MQRNHQPALAIGLVVYNGQRYLAQAIDSILGQTYGDFELILSDNASTDGTEAICRDYARRDQRVRYIRRVTNLGVADNFNAVFHDSNSEYFRWAADDDMMLPQYLEQCMSVLRADPDLAGVNSRIEIVDQLGKPIRMEPQPVDIQSSRADKRYITSRSGRERAIWSIMRSDFIRRTHMHGPFADSELHFQAEMCLLGRFAIVPSPLLQIRLHPTCYTVIAEKWKNEDYHQWWGPKYTADNYWLTPRLLSQQAVSIFKAPIPATQKFRCIRLLAREAYEFGAPIVLRNYRRVRDRLGRFIARSTPHPQNHNTAARKPADKSRYESCID